MVGHSLVFVRSSMGLLRPKRETKSQSPPTISLLHSTTFFHQHFFFFFTHPHTFATQVVFFFFIFAAMHQTILTIAIFLLLIVQTTLAVVLEDGDYRIYYGNYHVPKTYRFFTAQSDTTDGSVQTYPREKDLDDDQIWRLRNEGRGQVTLESKGAPGKYLGLLRRSGAHAGAYLGVVPTPVKFLMAKDFDGPFKTYELVYPERVDGKILAVSLDDDGDDDGDKKEPYFVNFAIRGTEDVLDSYLMSRVSD